MDSESEISLYVISENKDVYINANLIEIYDSLRSQLKMEAAHAFKQYEVISHKGISLFRRVKI